MVKWLAWGGGHDPIMTVFNLEDGVEYDWISVQGLPALKERKYFHVLEVL